MMNSKEELLLQSLVNPDEAEVDTKYSWDYDIQQQILGLLLKDRYFLVQAIDLLKPNYFVEDIHGRICKTLFSYFRKYNVLPLPEYVSLHIKEEVDSSSPVLNYFLGEIDAVYDSYEPGMEHREFLLDKITEFAKVQAVRVATSKMLPLLSSKQADKWTRIRDLWDEALRVERNVDIGLSYFDTIEERYERMKRANEDDVKFITGLKSIDDALQGGLSKGEIGAFAGASGSGKSVCLSMVAYRNMLRGKKVAYISLEMDEDKVSQRFDAMFSRVGIRDLLIREDEAKEKIKEQHLNLVGKYFLSDNDKRQLIVKQFPASSSDCNTIRAYLTQLQLFGFFPDLVVVDYVGELRDYPMLKTHESREKHVRELRSIALEFDACVFTAMQLNRSAKEAMKEGEFVDDDCLADSSGQVRPLDALWMICQNEQQKKAGIGYITVAKHRNGDSRYRLFYRQDKHTLLLNEITEEKFKRTLAAVNNQDKDPSIDGSPSMSQE